MVHFIMHNTYIHHTYIHTYIYTYIHTCITGRVWSAAARIYKRKDKSVDFDM